ncbi:class I SAM-dependent methyltransferase [Microvirga flavescens]|uniref:class I SAM-dependent methyltransferase n=1 Tax=Microvirga flavescens TaxID=2249811 RepID=UPI000DD9D25C|nr:class I SAM-dependent methyltransferase [Microvirga flavescens]
MTSAQRNAGSFRDPSGHVFESAGRIFRTINERARSDYETVRDKGVLTSAVEAGFLIESREIEKPQWKSGLERAAYVVEHPKIDFISYAYEWSFGALKAAALHHLDFQLHLLKQDAVLSDATAYNIQFVGSKPVFIDLLSVRPYREGEFWIGHRQFCEQFLNPLLLQSTLGIAHNTWFRGNLEGIPTADLARALPFKSCFSWNMLSQVILQAKLQAKATDAPDQAIQSAKKTRTLSRTAYEGMLRQLRNWIATLNPANTGKTVWGDYAKDNTYSSDEANEKRRFIAEFAAATRPNVMIDIGCNTGDYSVAALEGGANYVVGFDFDQRALDLAFSRSVEGGLKYQPLWLDASNPSPDQGWRQAERSGFSTRARVDGLIALAFEHHLAIAKNVPLPEVVNWLVDIAPVGVIEFVPKSDPTVQKMLALREDIFDDYTIETFSNALAQRGRIVKQEKVSQSGRTLFFYDRS